MGGWVEIMGEETPEFKNGVWSIRLLARIEASSTKEKVDGKKIIDELGFEQMISDPNRYFKKYEIAVNVPTMAEAIANTNLKDTFDEILLNS